MKNTRQPNHRMAAQAATAWKLSSMAFVAALATGCTVSPSDPSRDHTQGAFPADFDDAVNAFVESSIRPTMREPGAMELRPGDGDVYTVRCYDDVVMATVHKVHATFVYINGKNAYGGYTGFKPYAILFKDGEPFSYISDYGPRSREKAYCWSFKDS